VKKEITIEKANENKIRREKTGAIRRRTKEKTMKMPVFLSALLRQKWQAHKRDNSDFRM
jgi:hypothetical protein